MRKTKTKIPTKKEVVKEAKKMLEKSNQIEQRIYKKHGNTMLALEMTLAMAGTPQPKATISVILTILEREKVIKIL